MIVASAMPAIRKSKVSSLAVGGSIPLRMQARIASTTNNGATLPSPLSKAKNITSLL